LNNSEYSMGFFQWPSVAAMCNTAMNVRCCEFECGYIADVSADPRDPSAAV
jgi:hypothetical protein